MVSIKIKYILRIKLNYNQILEELYNEAITKKIYSKELNTITIQNIETIAQNSFNQKGVFTVFVTLSIYKIIHPEQDIRNHQIQIKNGFSGRSIDTKYITPTLKKLGLPSMAESGWLTRSLEQPYPYNLDYEGKISNKAVKKAFLELVNDIEINQINPKYILVELFKLIIEEQGVNKNSSSTLVNIPKNIKIKNKSDITPTLGVKTVAETLASIIVNQYDDSGMMIGIFGKWGRGKTYLAEQTWEQIKEKKPKYKRIVFSAWKYQDTKSSWAYLYENFINEYLVENEENSFVDKVKNYLNKSKKIWKLNLEKHTWFPIISFGLLFTLAVVWSFFVDKIWLVKSLVSIFGLVVLIKLFFLYLQQKTSAIGLYQRYFTRKSYSDNLGFQSEVENELTNLLKTWIPESNQDEKVVLFVDDIDRCNIEQVISIIDGLRVILDNPEIHERLIIITAIDEKILKEALKHKYESIEDNKIDMMYGEYLEKIFLIGLKLNKLNNYEIEDFLNNILPEKQEEYTKSVYLGDNTFVGEKTFSNGEDIEKVSKKTTEEPKIEKSDYEISNKEREYLIEVIKKLENTTPRKIRIFYYKYLIMKQLFHIRLEEKDLIVNWHDDSDEKIIADILVHLANKNDLDKFENDKNTKIIEELKYVAEMVSVL